MKKEGKFLIILFVILVAINLISASIIIDIGKFFNKAFSNQTETQYTGELASIKSTGGSTLGFNCYYNPYCGPPHCPPYVEYCEDNNLCTTDTCSHTTGCVYTPVSCPSGMRCDSSTGSCTCYPACNDNNLCTTDTCTSSGCSYTLKSCSSGYICSVSTGSCVCVPNCTNKVCGDSNSCGGKCNLTCNDDNKCTNDVCSLNGCIFSNVSCPSGEVCHTNTGCVFDCVDNDNDGYDNCNSGVDDDGKMIDCNDNSLNVNIGKFELCDNIDNNCDGLVDENNGDCSIDQICNNGLCIADCLDNDNDGYDNCDNENPADDGKMIDCNDSIFNIRPNINESCDGIDNNCNDAVDEGCSCVIGQIKQCGISNVGRCQYGSQTCINFIWGECTGSINAISETCNGIDDDCDGTIDEELKRQCGVSDVGVCKFGVEVCVNGIWQNCNAIFPSVEVCGGNLDSNCDGKIGTNCEFQENINTNQTINFTTYNSSSKANKIKETPISENNDNKNTINMVIFIVVLVVCSLIPIVFLIVVFKNYFKKNP